MSGRSAFGFAVLLPVCVAASVACAGEPAPSEKLADAVPAEGGPRIAVDAMTINVGDVVRGQDLVGTFKYRNAGDAPLHILSAKPG